MLPATSILSRSPNCNHVWMCEAYVIMWGGYGGYCYGVVVLNLFITVLCGFVYFCNVWGCVCVGFVLYGCVRLM